ncbi:MAG TPA: type II secretion system protein [Burkholderiaceae bacterium]|jgi:type II secretory pathway pseudopilin PulG
MPHLSRQHSLHTLHFIQRKLSRGIQRNCGFTYLGLMILIAIIGIASATSLELGTLMQRRLAEETLLDIGKEFQRALVSYANATPPGQSPAPSSLQDLLKDPRYPNIRRHLRKLYADPMTGKETWGLVPSIENKGIVGIYSLSQEKPIKVGNFDPLFQSFEGKTSYRDWVFMAAQPGAPASTSLSPALQPLPSAQPTQPMQKMNEGAIPMKP